MLPTFDQECDAVMSAFSFSIWRGKTQGHTHTLRATCCVQLALCGNPGKKSVARGGGARGKKHNKNFPVVKGRKDSHPKNVIMLFFIDLGKVLASQGKYLEIRKNLFKKNAGQDGKVNKCHVYLLP